MARTPGLGSLLDVDRRDFLRLIGLCAAQATLGWAAVGARPTPATDPPTAVPYAPRLREVLRRPIVLAKGDVLEGKSFTLAPDFAWTQSMAAIYASGPGIVIRNVDVIGASEWQPRWDAYREPVGGPAGIPSGCAGIRMQRVPGAQVTGVTVTGFPGPGFTAFGLDDAFVRDVRVSHCFAGVVVEWYQRNHRVLVEDVHAEDLWGPGPGRWPRIGGAPSRRRPGKWMGGDGLVLESLRASTVRNCTAVGEQFGSFKLVNPQDVQVSGLQGVNLMVQGTSDLDWKIDTVPAKNVRVSGSTLDKSLGTGEIVDAGNALQISWNVENILIENCVLRAAGHDGHGIQFAKYVHGRVVGCTIEGFNGRRGQSPAYAIEVTDGSTVNDDFAKVNTFVDQHRIILRD